MEKIVLDLVDKYYPEMLTVASIMFVLFIDLSPSIKWNPIKSIFKLIGYLFKLLGHLLNKETQDTLELMKNDINKSCSETNVKFDKVDFALRDMHDEFIKEIKASIRISDLRDVKRLRWEILDFANSCKNGRQHSEDEYLHIFDIHKDYENIIAQYEIPNGVVEIEYKYLHDLYLSKCINCDFL